MFVYSGAVKPEIVTSANRQLHSPLFGRRVEYKGICVIGIRYLRRNLTVYPGFLTQ